MKKWVTEYLLELICERKRYYILKKKSPTNVFLQQKYIQIGETIKRERFSLRTKYNSNLINKCSNDPKQMWKHINEIIYNKKTQSNTIGALFSGNNITTNANLITDTFNVYFRDVGKSLYENLTQSNVEIVPRISNRTIAHSMILWNANEDEVINKINSLKNSKSTKDTISSSIAKESALPLAPVLCDFINQSFNTGVFPSKLKCSRIVPIYKDGNPLQASNYRPISILPCMSKIIEALLCDRINNFISKNNIINENQFVFQKNSGALSAAATLVDTIQTKLDAKKNLVACCVFIDLRKAFDTIPHSKLLEKLQEYGIRGNVNKLIASYLDARAQFVDINDIFSEILVNENEFGLPQGSNLGPLLFLVYINGIFDLKLNSKLILFADDAVLVCTGDDIEALKAKMQTDLNTLAAWFLNNKLTVNEDKTKFMIVKPAHARVSCNNFSLAINQKHIQRVETFRYLGITIQENLKWNVQVDSICSKLAGVAGAAKRLGNGLYPSTWIAFYYAMCNSYLTYLAPIWNTSITQSDYNKLQIAQNYAIRVIFSLEYNAGQMSTLEILNKNKILNVKKRYNITIT